MIRIGQASVRLRIRGIDVDRLLEVIDGLSDALVGELIPGISALQIQAVGFPVFGLRSPHVLGLRKVEAKFQFFRDVLNDFLLKVRHIR